MYFEGRTQNLHTHREASEVALMRSVEEISVSQSNAMVLQNKKWVRGWMYWQSIPRSYIDVTLLLIGAENVDMFVAVQKRVVALLKHPGQGDKDCVLLLRTRSGGKRFGGNGVEESI